MLFLVCLGSSPLVLKIQLKKEQQKETLPQELQKPPSAGHLWCYTNTAAPASQDGCEDGHLFQLQLLDFQTSGLAMMRAGRS